MSKRLAGVLGATLTLLSLTILAVGQTPTTSPPTTTAPTTPITTTPTTMPATTTTEQVPAIQNPDGTYTIVENKQGEIPSRAVNSGGPFLCLAAQKGSPLVGLGFTERLPLA